MCRRVRSPFCSRKGGRRKRRRAAAAAAGRLQACNWKRARVLCSGACCIKCYELKRSLECYVSVEFYEILLTKRSILRYVSMAEVGLVFQQCKRRRSITIPHCNRNTHSNYCCSSMPSGIITGTKILQFKGVWFDG